MKMKNIKYFAITLILLCCLMGAASAADDVSADIVDASADAVVVDAVSEDVSDSPDVVITDDEEIDDSIVEEAIESNRQNPQTYDISDDTTYNQYIGTYGLNGNPGDTYNFVSNFSGKTVYIDKDNTTITSASNVVLTNCGFSINPNISGVTITGLNIQNTISSYPIYVGPNCADISIDHNNIFVNYTSSSASWLYGIDFNAYDWGTNITYNFNNIDITDNTIWMYGNSYVCGIYGSDFINSNVLRNTIYAYSDTGSTSAGNNAVYGLALCDDSTWTVVSRPQNNTIANNNVTVIGQSVYGIEDFGINQNVSNNNIQAIANTTGSAYGIALGILDDAIINENIIYITAGNLTQSINIDMIHGSNAGIRLHSNSTHGYYCNNVTINDDRIYYNTFISLSYYSPHIQNDVGNTNIDTTGTWYSYYWDSNPYTPTYPNVQQNRVLKSTKEILGAIDSSILSASDVIYVNPVNGDNSNDGSELNPVKSIDVALGKINPGGTIILNEGTYIINQQPLMISQSVSIKGTNRENTIIQLAPPIMTQFMSGGGYFVNFSNLTIQNGQVICSAMGSNPIDITSNFINITFEKLQSFAWSPTKVGSSLNIINCSFNECGAIALSGADNTYSVNINSSSFKKMNNIFLNSMKNPVAVNYCSFINCKNIVGNSNNKVSVTFNNSYFDMNDNPSTITNVDMDNWVVMSFENTTGLNVGEDAGFLVSFKKVAHADGTITDLENPELLSFPIFNVSYTLVNGTEVTHTLENLEDAATLPITGYGTIRATAGGQTLGVTVGKEITLNIQRDDAIGYGGEQNLVFISDYNDITGNMTVTITGPNYSMEQTLPIYGGRSFLTLKDLNVGEYTVEVAYSGDDIYYPKSASTTFNVLPVESDDITLNVYVNNITFSEAADILVFVGPKGATGTVTITIDGNDVTEALDGNGIASFSINGLPINDYDITVKYNGDSNFESATTTAAFSVSANPIIDDLNTQLNQTKEELASVTAEAAIAQEQVANLTADVASAQEQVANLTADVAKVQEQITQLTQENAKLTDDLSVANKNAAAASNNANAKIKKIKAAKTVKKSKKYVITVTLNKKVKGKVVFVAFNGKVYKAKTNAKGIAKVTIKKAALKKLAGKKVKYQVISGNSLKNKSVKVKK